MRINYVNKELCTGKHLRIENLLMIEYGLDQNYTLKEIAERVKKDSKNYRMQLLFLYLH